MSKISDMNDAPEKIWDDSLLRFLMHVHPAQHHHDDVRINCTAQALERLRAAFLSGDVGECARFNMMCSDGECYDLQFNVMDQWQMASDVTHYATPGLDYEWVSYGDHTAMQADRDQWKSRAEKAEAACVEWSDVSQRNYPRAKAADAAMQWQSIDTAPKDGTEILTIRENGFISKAVWYDNPFGRLDTVVENASGKWWSVTHWMPLPQPPETP